MMAVQGDSSAGELLRKDVVNFLRLLVRTEALCESGVAVDGVRDFQKRIEVLRRQINSIERESSRVEAAQLDLNPVQVAYRGVQFLRDLGKIGVSSLRGRSEGEGGESHSVPLEKSGEAKKHQLERQVVEYLERVYVLESALEEKLLKERQDQERRQLLLAAQSSMKEKTGQDYEGAEERTEGTKGKDDAVEENGSDTDEHTALEDLLESEVRGTNQHDAYVIEDLEDEAIEKIVHNHRRTQEELTSEIMQLVGELKDKSIAANDIIRDDSKRLDDVDEALEQNRSRIQKENVRVKQQLHQSSLCSQALYALMLFVVLSFFATYAFMKVFPK